MRSMRWAILVVLVFAPFVGGASRALAGDLSSAVILPAADVKWTDNPALKGARIAVLWGDPKTSGYGALKSLPGGAALAAHTHSQDQRVLLMSGTLVLTMAGQKPATLGSGSYAFVPAGAVHAAACGVGAECVYFEEQQGPADIKFQEPARE